MINSLQHQLEKCLIHSQNNVVAMGSSLEPMYFEKHLLGTFRILCGFYSIFKKVYIRYMDDFLVISKTENDNEILFEKKKQFFDSEQKKLT